MRATFEHLRFANYLGSHPERREAWVYPPRQEAHNSPLCSHLATQVPGCQDRGS
jgi:hypothetical protein